MKIKKIPRWANIVFFRAPKGLALGDTVYLSNNYFEQFESGRSSVELEALIAHEAEHLKRFRELGRFSLVRYFLDPKFRLQEELYATKAEIAVFRKERGRPIAQIDVSLDYSTLTHGMRLNGSGDNLGGLDVSLLFYSWASPVEGKIACNADLLSAVKVANFFKRKGYDIELALTQNTEYIAK